MGIQLPDGCAMKPLHAIAELPGLAVGPAPAGFQATKPANRRGEIEAAWVAEAIDVLRLGGPEVPAKLRWLFDGEAGTPDARNLAELGRWAAQLGPAHCRRAAEIAATRYQENRQRKDARRRVGKALRELRLFLTARQRQMKRRRRESLLAELAQTIDRYRVRHPGIAHAEIAAAVRDLLAGVAQASAMAQRPAAHSKGRVFSTSAVVAA